jgi:hypothetical protein
MGATWAGIGFRNPTRPPRSTPFVRRFLLHILPDGFVRKSVTTVSSSPRTPTPSLGPPVFPSKPQLH